MVIDPNAVSNSYGFGKNAKLDELIIEAYRNIGIPLNLQSAEQFDSAVYSANLELSTWPSKGLNLFLVQPMMVSINAGQSYYQLPDYGLRILYNECVILQPIRLNQNGTAFSSAGGNPNNCFDPTQTAGCTQTTPNGSIGYNYGMDITNSILYVGVSSLSQTDYTLAIDCSNNGTEWQQVYLSPKTTFYPSVTQWFVLQVSPSAQYWRIRETGGNTLAINQIYFSVSNLTTPNRTIGAISRSQYMAMQTTTAIGSAITGYYLNLINPPVLVIYPQPIQDGFNLLFNTDCYPPDVVYLFQRTPVPQNFLDALMQGIAYRLSRKYKPEKVAECAQLAKEAYDLAGRSNYENVPLNFMPDISAFGVN